MLPHRRHIVKEKFDMIAAPKFLEASFRRRSNAE